MQLEGFAMAIDIDIDTEVDAAGLDAEPNYPESRSAFSALGLDNGKVQSIGSKRWSLGETRCGVYVINIS